MATRALRLRDIREAGRTGQTREDPRREARAHEGEVQGESVQSDGQ